MCLAIIEDVRRLSGGSQSHLMRASDGNHYVVKFQGNPQGTGVLANEYLAARLAALLGLPIPPVEIVEVPPEMCRELYFETPDGRRPVPCGLHAASRVVMSTVEGRVYDFLPRDYGNSLRNPDALVGIRVFDLWVYHRDRRQALYWRFSREKKFSVAFIDNGHCFGGPDWALSNRWYIESCDKFLDAEPWIRKIEELPPQCILDVISSVPLEWCGSSRKLEVLYGKLRERQSALRTVIRELEGIQNSDQGSKLCSEEQVHRFNSAAGRFATARTSRVIMA